MRRLLILTVIIAFLSPAANSNNIYITYPDDINVYQDIAKKLTERLQVKNNKSNHLIIAASNNELNLKSPKKNDLIVSINNPKLIENNPNQYASDILLTFNSSYSANESKKIFARKNRGIINIDQPLETLIKTAKKTIKSNYKKYILLIISEENKDALLQIKNIGPINNNEIKIIKIKKGDVAAKIIEPELFNAAAIIAIRDTHIWSGNSARWILQQAYSYKVPIIGYSKSFLKAGAMISIYSSVDQILDKTELEINQWIKTGYLNKKTSTPAYTIEVNDNIARALNFSNTKIIDMRQKQ